MRRKITDDDSALDMYAVLAAEYFQLRVSSASTRKLVSQHDFDMLLREFGLAAGVAKGETDQVCLAKILKLTENDFMKARHEYAVKTWNLDAIPRKDFKLDSNSAAYSFCFYLEELRRKNLLRNLFMDFARKNEKAEAEKFSKEFEEDCINRDIEYGKKHGYSWAEDDTAKWLNGLTDEKARKWFGVSARKKGDLSLD